MKNSGFILVTVLIFLFLLTLLSIHTITESQLQWRLHNNFSLSKRELQVAEVGLKTGEKQLINNPSSQEIFILRYNQIEVHYIIEKLSGSPCLKLADAQLQQGAYYRITAWTGDKTRILQTTDAQPLNVPCLSSKKIIQPGRLSWREL